MKLKVNISCSVRKIRISVSCREGGREGERERERERVSILCC